MEVTIKKWLKWLKENEQTVSMAMGAIVIVALGYYLVTKNVPPTPTTTSTTETQTETTSPVALKETENGLMPENLPENYTVKKGDLLWAIAEKHYGSGFNWVDIAKANNLKNANNIETGMTLKLPNVRVRVPVGVDPKTLAGSKTEVKPAVVNTSSEKYTVEAGDSLWSISVKMYNDGYKWMSIYKANTDIIKNPGVIEKGWELKIPKN